jgi:excisionase family DNA binding protein
MKPMTKHEKPAHTPVLLTIENTEKIYGWSRSTQYRLLRAGKLRAVKVGSRTLVIAESCEAAVAQAPAATFRTPSRSAVEAQQAA